MELILYSKTGCHLCEGLEEKLRAIDDIDINLEIRDITKNKEWWEKYQYEIPVLYLVMDGQEKLIPRNSPRISVNQLSKVLQKFANKQ
ncbi:glutaredoxin family protein [Cyanobacterium aponinum AL20118]|uniref:Glutaredoxin family protein n=1 Tax=Cyanobacterium aponinum AL20115 TaxID=3090662 RepID=A0AAF1C5C8_9CHRO|nr:glutaredoxin family protein [Cyanobacterium aponinum]WPF88555.1 glutaredoxin family protein [Cyanobacterium aponinum AL20115]WRL39750.1 glutaredoxin family protein [Cyanobacterium aponinum UTEX 3221]